MPDYPIIDAHLHITDPARLRYPWMEASSRLHRAWSTADYDRLSGGLAIEAFVFVEVDAHPDDKEREADLVAEAAAADPRIRAVVAAVPMDRGKDTEVALARMRGHPLLRGVRHLIERHAAEPGWAYRPAMIDGVRLLGPLGLTFDLCLYAPQLRDAAALVAACPEVRFVLDHLGKPAVREGRLDPWREDLSALARLPNVLCKISGLATEAHHDRWTADELRPFLDHALSAFGEDRVMFGSDWFVSELAIALPRWVALVDEAASRWGSAGRAKLWKGTAREVYGIGASA